MLYTLDDWLRAYGFFKRSVKTMLRMDGFLIFEELIFQLMIICKIFNVCLNHISLASILWDMGKQSRTRSDAAFSDLVLDCLLTECTLKI